MGDVTRHEVIDGQQRMTTLQLLLDAVQEVVDDLGPEFLGDHRLATLGHGCDAVTTGGVRR
jgi:hypothetical protein